MISNIFRIVKSRAKNTLNRNHIFIYKMLHSQGTAFRILFAVIKIAFRKLWMAQFPIRMLEKISEIQIFKISE